MLTITNGKVISDMEILENKNIVLDDGKIISIADDIPAGSKVLDAAGNYVSPGFVDIHIHGADGCDVMDGTYDSVNRISKAIARHGVTSFVPTTMTLGKDRIANAIANIRECKKRGTEGAGILGLHIEGPFISPNARGAHDLQYIVPPDAEFLADIADSDYSIIKQITIAPELEGAKDFIKFIVGQGMIASIGHSAGTYEDAIGAIECGASHSTHLYNAMTPLKHRAPGIVGAIFDSGITTEMICDGIHLHFAAIRLAIAVKGYNNIALITDSMQACGMKDGKYSLGGLDVYVKDGAARLKDGTLAGSTLTIDKAVRNVIGNTNLNIAEAVAMATKVPARIVREDRRKGYIKPGYDADIVIFDRNINIKTTIIGGRVLSK